MPKKVVRKPLYRKAPRSENHTPLLFLVGFLVIGSFFAISYRLQSHPQVLGASILLAKGGDDLQEESGPSHSESQNNTNQSQEQSEQHSQPSQQNNKGENTVSTNSPAQAALVDCEGPDGKHFSTTFGQCQKLNNAFHKNTFKFTELSSPRSSDASNSASHKGKNENKQPLTVKMQGKSQSIRLDKEQNIQIATSDGKLSIKAHEDNGQEVGLDDHDTLDKINGVLKDDDLHISTTSGKQIAITQGRTTALSKLPLSIDPTTHILTVTTPTGDKQVTILPQTAIDSLVQKGVITSVQNEQTSSGATETTELTTLNNTPVFVVKGVSNKRLLGIIPVLLAKKAYVSAEDGSVVQVDQTPLNTLLNALSL